MNEDLKTFLIAAALAAFFCIYLITKIFNWWNTRHIKKNNSKYNTDDENLKDELGIKKLVQEFIDGIKLNNKKINLDLQ
ncbi:MAG: hypothetical protein K4H23_04775 [Mollicutes bacterium PWAP]|nr:hypothetical protein [Mollicutes bacterium PWAP]